MLARNELLHAHAVIDISHVHRTIFSNGQIVAPINLAVIISEAAPLREDFAGEVKLQDLATVGRRRFEVASVDYVKQIVWADCKRPGSAQFFRLPHFQELSVGIEYLDA